MEKPREPITARTPPAPSESHAEIEDRIRRGMPDLHPIVKRLDGMIRETIPRRRYAVRWKKAYYGLPELGWIIEMAAYDVSVNVVFIGGAEFDPPPPLGSTDRSRYVKVKTLEEARAPESARGSSKQDACRAGDEPTVVTWFTDAATVRPSPKPRRVADCRS